MCTYVVLCNSSDRRNFRSGARPLPQVGINLQAVGPTAIVTTPPLPERISTGSLGLPAAAALLAPHQPVLCCTGSRLSCQVEEWDCGYANVESLCATIAATHPSLVAASRLRLVKGHREIQRLVEGGWQEGLDPEGYEAYNGNLVGKTGRPAWLGADGSLTLLWHLRVEAFVVEVVDRVGAGDAVYSIAAACLERGGEPGREPGGGAPSRKRQRGSSREDEEEPESFGSTRPPLLLQHQGHSRSILGVLPPPSRRLLLRDPRDAPGKLQLVRPDELDGRQYQVTVAGRAQARGGATAGALSLSEEEVGRRRGSPEPAAILQHGVWQHASWCGLKFG